MTERDRLVVDDAEADGTTGRSFSSGRRTHIIQILRDSKLPLSAREVANLVDVHLNTARFHLENLVDAGLATRQAEQRATPGRPRTMYTGTLPNQTHERAQGYRLLAEILTTAVSNQVNAPEVMRSVGRSWGRTLIHTPSDTVPITDAEACERIVTKMDALWFASEVSADDPHDLVMHNCPFLALAMQLPEAVCSLHAGLVDGSLAELGSGLRTVEIRPLATPHTCHLLLARADPNDGPPRLTYDQKALGPGARQIGPGQERVP